MPGLMWYCKPRHTRICSRKTACCPKLWHVWTGQLDLINAVLCKILIPRAFMTERHHHNHAQRVGNLISDVSIGQDQNGWSTCTIHHHISGTLHRLYIFQFIVHECELEFAQLWERRWFGRRTTQNSVGAYVDRYPRAVRGSKVTRSLLAYAMRAEKTTR